MDPRLAKRIGVTSAALDRTLVTLNRVGTLAVPPEGRLALLVRLLRGSGVAERIASDLLAVLPTSSPADLLAPVTVGDKRLRAIVDTLERLGPVVIGEAVVAAEAPARLTTLAARVSAVEAERDTALAAAASARVERDTALAAASAAPVSAVPPDAMAIDGLARSVGQQLSSAQRVLADHPMRLGQVSVTLRGVAVPAGNQVALSFGEAGPTSEVQFGFLPTRPTGAVLPDLRGYTEPLARRKLAKLGLEVAVVGVPGAPGVVQSHTPAAGTPVEAGMRVDLSVGT